MNLSRKRFFPNGISRSVQNLLIVFLAVLLFVLVNLLAYRPGYSIPMPDGNRPLAPRSVAMLEKIDRPIGCTVILPRSNRYYVRLRTLLSHMRDAMGTPMDEPVMLDPHTDPARASSISDRYGMRSYGIIFTAADGRVEKVPYDSLFDRIEKARDSIGGTHAASKRFCGESVLVGALNRVSRPSAPVVRFLTGHGECDIEDYDPLRGYSDLAREIRREGYELRPLRLGESTMPVDCDLLFIAGPRRVLSDYEAETIKSYLRSGGRMLLLLDRSDRLPDKWEDILGEVGLASAHLTAIDQRTLGGYTLLVDRFSEHPIAKDLEKSAVYFISPQVFFISPRRSPSGALCQAHVVAAAPDGAWGEVDPDSSPRRYDAGIDTRGRQLPLAVAVECPNGNRLGLKTMRAFVIGDSDIGSNQLVAGGRTANRDLLLNAINWLTENDLAFVPSRQVDGGALRYAVSPTRRTRYWYYSVVCWPLASALFGFFASCLRKITA